MFNINYISRKVLFFITLLFYFVSEQASGLTLGNIKSQSTLQQPLKAQIELLGANFLDLKGFNVKSAPAEVYKTMGVKPTAANENLKFSVSSNNEGKYFIGVHTLDVITDPTVNFIIEVDWNEGRLLQKFTASLAPSTQQNQQNLNISAPQTAIASDFTRTPDQILHDNTFQTSGAIGGKVLANDQPSQNPVQRMDTNQNKRSRSGLAVSTSAKLPKGEVQPLLYKVKKNDYLWLIAQKLRPSDVSAQQMMLAIQRENPDAFYGNTGSHLKVGSVLRISNYLIQQNAHQNRERLSYNKTNQVKNAVLVESINSKLEDDNKLNNVSVENSAVKKVSNRELIIPVNEQEGKEAAQTKIELQAAKKRLNDLNIELTIANETAEATRRENKALLTRLNSAEEQMSEMQSLIQLKDAEIQRMELKGSILVKERADPKPLVSLDLGNDSNLENKIITQKSIDHNAMEDTIRSLLHDPVAIATSIFVGLFVIMIAWVLTRKPININDEEFIFREKSIDELFPEDESELNRKIITIRSDSKDADFADELKPISENSSKSVEFIEASDELVDYLEQADIYLSYEKFDRAEALLKSAIEKTPLKHEYQLKLLEVYAQKKDIQSFDKQADILFVALGGNEDQPLWKDAEVLAEQIESKHPLFLKKESLSSDNQFLEEKETTLIEWGPEQVTDIAEQTSSEVHEPQNKSDSKLVQLNSEKDEELIDNEPDNQDSTQKTTNIESSETDPINNNDKKYHDAEVIQPGGAVARIISELQKSRLDKFRDDATQPGVEDMFLLSDEVSTKLDLARAYLEMGDQEGAKDLLNEVIDEGNKSQRFKARELLEGT